MRSVVEGLCSGAPLDSCRARGSGGWMLTQTIYFPLPGAHRMRGLQGFSCCSHQTFTSATTDKTVALRLRAGVRGAAVQDQSCPAVRQRRAPC